jgi:hypothetical protein
MLLLFYDDAYGHRITFFGAGNLAAKAGSALFPGLVTALLAILAAAGFLLSWQKRGSMLPFFGSWFCISFACYLLYNYAVDFHALAALVALMPLAAFAIWHFSLQLPALNVAIPALLLALSALSPAAASPEMLLETQLMSTIAAELPQGCRLIMEVPTIVSPVPGMSTMEFLNIHSNAPELPKGRCFLYFEDAYCVKDLLPNSAKRCGLMRSHFRMAKLKEYYGEGIIFGLYEVEQPYRNSMKNASVLLPP